MNTAKSSQNTYKVTIKNGQSGTQQGKDLPSPADGQPSPARVKAQAGDKYQLEALSGDQRFAPDKVKLKRVGSNLHIALDEAADASLIVEDYYSVMPEGYNGVVGQAENGNFYEYIPEDPDVKGLIPQLADGGQAVSVALGGAEVVGSGAAIALLAFNPLLAGLGLLSAGAAAAAAGAGGGGTTTVAGQKTALAIDPISADNIITATEGNATNVLVTGRVTGVFKEGDVVELVVNNKTYAASVKADGTFSVPVAMADLKADADTKIDASINGTGGDRGTASQDYQALTQGGPTTTALVIDPVTGDNFIGAAENTGNIAVTGKVSGLFSAGDVVTLARGIVAKGPKVVFITEGAQGARAITACHSGRTSSWPRSSLPNRRLSSNIGGYPFIQRRLNRASPSGHRHASLGRVNSRVSGGGGYGQYGRVSRVTGKRGLSRRGNPDG